MLNNVIFAGAARRPLATRSNANVMWNRIGLTRSTWQFVIYLYLHRGKCPLKNGKLASSKASQLAARKWPFRPEESRPMPARGDRRALRGWRILRGRRGRLMPPYVPARCAWQHGSALSKTALHFSPEGEQLAQVFS